MKVKIKNSGFEIIEGSKAQDRVYVFTWKNGENHKIYWGTTEKLVVEKFQVFANDYFETIEEASFWYGDVEQELLIENISKEDTQNVLNDINNLLHQMGLN